MEKVAIIVPRFGHEVIGGSERLALNYARLLSSRYQVDVITTGALEYETWLEYYPLGRSEFEHNIDVWRFPTDKGRWDSVINTNSWQGYDIPYPGSYKIPLIPNPKESLDNIRNTPVYNTERFIIEQGPQSEQLYQFLTAKRDTYKKVIFTPYLYPTTYLGIDRVRKDRVIILPAAHNEPHIYFPCLRKYANYKWAVYFKEEADMLNAALCTNNTNVVLVKPSVGTVSSTKINESNEYRIASMGRATDGKNFKVLAELVDKFRLKYPNLNTKLHVIGSVGDDVKDTIKKWKDWIVVHGSVDEQSRNDLLSSCDLLVNPSVLDSFGLVNLEAARLGVPVLLNEQCPAFKALNKVSKDLFIMFETRDQDNRFVDALFKLRNKDIRLARGEALKRWADSDYSEDASLKSLYSIIEG